VKIHESPPARPTAPDAPLCDRCDTPMKIKTIVPTMFAHAIDDIVYRCPACGIESVKSFKRSK